MTRPNVQSVYQHEEALGYSSRSYVLASLSEQASASHGEQQVTLLPALVCLAQPSGCG